MKHGPIALIDEQMPVVALATHDHVFEKMQGNIQEAKARGGSIIAITTKGDTTLKELLSEDDSPRSQFLPLHRLLMPVVISSAVAAFVVLHRRPSRLRRRSAEESREERHGRIERGLDLLSSL